MADNSDDTFDASSLSPTDHARVLAMLANPHGASHIAALPDEAVEEEIEKAGGEDVLDGDEDEDDSDLDSDSDSFPLDDDDAGEADDDTPLEPTDVWDGD